MGQVDIARAVDLAELQGELAEVRGDVDTRIPAADKGVAGGVAPLDANGKLPLAHIPDGIEAGGGAGDDAGGLFVPDVIDPAVPLDITIVSNWGITDAGEVYYDEAGALEAEAGLLIPDPETGSVAVWRPGVPWQDYLDARMAVFLANKASQSRVALDADTGWLPLPTLTAGFTAQDNAAYRRVGNMVRFRGSLSWTGSGGPTVAFQLPEGFRPATLRRYSGAVDTAVIMGIRVLITGDVDIRFGSATGNFCSLNDVRFEVD